jgi:UDP-N-acetylglucosamine 2-epimerase (non-hydrolysing)
MRLKKVNIYNKLLKIIKEKGGNFLSKEYFGVEYLNNLAKKNNGICLSSRYQSVNHKYEWECQNNHTWLATTKHISNGTWCPVCNKESKGEKEISRILNELNINFIKEYLFNNCRGERRPLPFDFYLPDYNCCIEYDGEQHFIYRETGIFQNKLKKIKENEIIKTKYCNENNIRLIRIPYGFLKKLRKLLTIEYKNEFKNSVDYTKCILIVAGTRPEELKTFKLVQTLEKNFIPVLYAFTGQHKNIVNRNKYDFSFNIKENKESNRLDSIVVGNINNFGKFLNKHPYITHVMVQGDTTSAFAVALTAFHNNIKIIHLEAGLRTYNKQNPYPEEINRRLISQIADIHLCPTEEALKNLTRERCFGEFFVVGNTVIDNLLPYKEKCEYTNKILITLHRRENHHWLDQWFTVINTLAKLYPQYEFILPIHPNPNVQKHKHLLKYVKVIDPLSYEDMLNLLIKTRLVITDSGGLQEECSFFNKKCLTCRIITERPEAIGQSTFMIESPELLLGEFLKHINDYEINYDCPFGDGHAAERIYNIIEKFT